MSATWWQRLGTRRGSAGSITPFVLITVIALIPLAGLVIDGGRQLNGRARAIAYAQEAARAGAQALDLQVEQTRLVPSLAEELVRNFCADAIDGADGVPGDPTLVYCAPVLVPDQDESGQFLTIGVETRVEVDPLLLDIFGAGPLKSEGRAVARAFTGINEADEGAVPTVPPPTVAGADPGDGGLPTVGPGSQTPLTPGTVAPCVPPPPSTTPPPDGDGGGNDGGGGGGGGGGGDDDDPTPSPSTTPPTTPPTTEPTENNDLDDDQPPDCPVPPAPDDDEDPDPDAEQPADPR